MGVGERQDTLCVCTSQLSREDLLALPKRFCTQADKLHHFEFKMKHTQVGKGRGQQGTKVVGSLEFLVAVNTGHVNDANDHKGKIS